MTRLPRSFKVSTPFMVLALLLTLAFPALSAQDRASQAAVIDVPGAWTLVATTGPQARVGHVMAFDPGRHETVLFGGSESPSTSVRLGDTWEWNGTTWAPVASTGPSARNAAALVYHSAKHRSVLFGGAGVPGNPNQDNNDTWAWDGTTWKQIKLTNPPAGRNSFGFAFDIGRQQIVLFGGSITFQCDELQDTWELGSATWIQHFPATKPDARSEAGMVYDTARGRTVLFGGTGSGCSTIHFGDTWEWDGSSWTQVATTGPGTRVSHSMAYDKARGRTVLFGGSPDGVVISGDTWEWDGAAWAQAATTGPAPRFGTAMAYDGVSRSVLLFGGADNSGNVFSDTWAWAGPIYACAARTPGDLNCDRVVDGDDMAMLQSRMSIPVAGPTDPRDLNHDGKITAEDAQQFLRLCSKSDCR